LLDVFLVLARMVSFLLLSRPGHQGVYCRCLYSYNNNNNKRGRGWNEVEKLFSMTGTMLDLEYK
jgi:hypothetical protein